MSPREVAEWLNSKCTDEEFVETFALLYRAMYGRGIPEEYDRKTMIDTINVKALCNELSYTLDYLVNDVIRKER